MHEEGYTGAVPVTAFTDIPLSTMNKEFIVHDFTLKWLSVGRLLDDGVYD